MGNFRIRSGAWPLALAGLLVTSRCKNSDTLTGPLPTATPFAVTATVTRSPAATTPVSSTATPVPPTAVPATATPAPTRPIPTPTPLATPSGLSGSWVGDVQWLDLDWWWPCGDPRLTPNARVASAELTQIGSRLTGTLHTRCFDTAFHGALTGSQMRFTVTLPEALNNPVSAVGTATDSVITLPIPQYDSPCPGGPCLVGGFDIHLHR